MRWLARHGILSLTTASTLLLAAPLSFRTHELPWAAIGVDYRVTIQTLVDGRCLESNPQLSVIAGALPRGLALQGDWLTGVPKELGTFHVRVRGVTGCGAAEQDYVLQVTGRPILRISPEEIVFEYHVGDAPPEPQGVLVSSTWPELPYSVTATASWLHLQPEEGITPYSGAALAGDRVTLRVLINDLPPGVYEARLLFTAHQSASVPAIPVKLHVVARDR
jgi:hypothetical protein